MFIFFCIMHFKLKTLFCDFSDHFNSMIEINTKVIQKLCTFCKINFQQNKYGLLTIKHIISFQYNSGKINSCWQEICL